MAARAALVVLSALAALAACATDGGERRIPIPGRDLASFDSERERGFQIDRQVREVLPLVSDLTVLEFVDDLGQLMVERLGEQPFDYRFRVIVNPELNAFAVPGGYVYLHSGTILSAGDVEELAGVLAHELGHVKGRHSARIARDTAIPSILTNVAAIAVTAAVGDPTPLVAAQAVNVALQLQYTRQYEDEADRLGAIFLTRAGWRPDGMIRFFERIEMQETRPGAIQVPPYLYSHPQVEDRIEVVRDMARELRPVTTPPDLDDRFREVQARLAWLIESKRPAATPVAPYDRAATDPLLAEAERLRAAGRTDAALAALDRAERAEPNDPRVPYRRAELLEAEGRLADAIAAYRRAVHLDPNQTAVLLALGRAHRAAGHRREALFFLEQAGFRAGARGRARQQIESEIERLVFPMIVRSGWGEPGPAAADEGAAGAQPAAPAALPAAAERIEWWAKLAPHWHDRAEYLRARWIDPHGRVSEEIEVDRRARGVVVARLDLGREGAAPGPWRVELLLGDVAVHSDSIEAR